MKTKQLLCYLIILIVSTLSCQSKNNNTHYNNSLTIIVNNNTKIPLRIAKEEGFYSLGKHELISNKKQDTLSFSIEAFQFVYLSNIQNYIDTILVSRGDTLEVSVLDNVIKHQLKSSKSYSNINSIIKQFNAKPDVNQLLNKIDSLRLLFYFVNKKGKPFEGNDDYSKFKLFPLSVNRQNIIAKSKELEELSNCVLTYQNELKRFLNKEVDLPEGLLKSIVFKKQKESFDQLVILYNLSNNLNILKIITGNEFISDELNSNPYSQSYLLFFLRKKVIKKKPDYSKSKEYVDFKEAYDFSNQFLNDTLTKYAKLLSVKAMINYDEQDIEVKNRYANFKQTYKDERLNSALDIQYGLNLDKSKLDNNEVHLVDLNGTQKELFTIIKQNQGKLIYIDFWASWCAPCRAAMPSSMKLVEKYKGKDIVFIYLSLDKDLDKWKKAAEFEKLSGNLNSFNVMNQSNNFLKKLNVNLIPRYLLFDKNGFLIHENAPGPSGAEIKLLLDKYL